jgi:hypothetical protein
MMSDKPRDFSQMSKQERKAMVERLHVKFPRTEKVRKLIDHCRQHTKIAAEPECMLLVGERGNGKTTECKRYTSMFPRRVIAGTTTVPVLYVSIPSPTTTKSLPAKLLKELGDRFWDKGNTTVQTLRLCDLLDDTETELIIMDEFHGFIDGKTDRAVLEVSNWLKDFINQSRKPILLAGLPYCDIVLKANDQLERRFPVRETLYPMGWKLTKDKETFIKFLKYVDTHLPFDARSNLADEDVAHRIYCATNGVIDFVMKIVRRAAELAIDRNIKKLEHDLFARAYTERLSAIVPERPNPFTVDERELEIKPFPKSILGIMATNRRARPKTQEMSVSQIFSRS